MLAQTSRITIHIPLNKKYLLFTYTRPLAHCFTKWHRFARSIYPHRKRALRTKVFHAPYHPKNKVYCQTTRAHANGQYGDIKHHTCCMNERMILAECYSSAVVVWLSIQFRIHGKQCRRHRLVDECKKSGCKHQHCQLQKGRHLILF